MNRSILKLAIPNIISNISIPLLGFVDLVLIGRLGNEIFIGAIALGGMIFNILYWGFGFLRMGTTGLTAQAFGENNNSESSVILSRSMFIAIAGGFLLIFLQLPIRYFSLILVNGSEVVEGLASQYFSIRIYAAPATLGLFVLTGWFLGMQNARIPMIITVVLNILNIIFNYIFIYVFDLKSDGVAWGTLIAQYLGLLLALYFLLKKYPEFTKGWKLKIILEVNELKKFFKINLDIFIRTLCLIIVFTFFTSKSASTNDSILAVNTILMQFFFIFSYLTDGFAYAAEALTGKFIGGGNKRDLKIMIRNLFYWGAGLSLLFSIIYLFFGNQIVSIMTNNKDLLDIADKYIFWVALIPIISFASFLWDGIYIGATASAAMRNTMLISTFAVFFPVYFGLRGFFDNHTLWIALLLFLAARGISQTIIAGKVILIPDRNKKPGS